MIGIDIVEVSRIKKLITQHGDRFITKIYTASEIDYSRASSVMMYQRFAARFAAKEAVVKSLGTGFREITWKDIEVLKDELGKPYINLTEKAKVFCSEKRIKEIMISLSHTRVYAVAQAVVVYKI